MSLTSPKLEASWSQWVSTDMSKYRWPNTALHRMAARCVGWQLWRHRGAAIGELIVRPHHAMKTCVASVIFLLVGLAVGFYIGYRDYQKHIASEAVQQLVESTESGEF